MDYGHHLFGTLTAVCIVGVGVRLSLMFGFAFRIIL
jgi:hypothetical protein